MISQYINAMRQRFIAFRQHQAIPREPIHAGEIHFFMTFPVHPYESKGGFVFVPLEAIINRVIERAPAYSLDTPAPVVLGVQDAKISILGLEAFLDPVDGTPLFDNDNGYLKCNTHPIPRYHDCATLNDYTWSFHPHEEGEKRPRFSVYQVDGLFYQVLKNVETFAILGHALIACITHECKYSDEEAAAFYEEMRSLHHFICDGGNAKTHYC